MIDVKARPARTIVKASPAASVKKTIAQRIQLAALRKENRELRLALGLEVPPQA